MTNAGTLLMALGERKTITIFTAVQARHAKVYQLRGVTADRYTVAPSLRFS
jgi:hypothetical protein